jgi:hypothetical protein
LDDWLTNYQAIVSRKYLNMYKELDIPLPLDLQETAKQTGVEEADIKDSGKIVMVPDQRMRRMQHLLAELVELIDKVSGMNFNRKAFRCRSANLCDCSTCSPDFDRFYWKEGQEYYTSENNTTKSLYSSPMVRQRDQNSSMVKSPV